MCYYEYGHKYHYSLSVDLDEIIIPLEHANYSELFEYLIRDSSYSNATSIMFRWAFFKGSVATNRTSNISARSVILSNRKYSLTWQKQTDDRELLETKSFTSTKWCSFLFNHHCLLNNPDHPNIYAPLELAMAHHYRRECKPKIDNGLHCERDTTTLPSLDQVLRYKDSLQKILEHKFNLFDIG